VTSTEAPRDPCVSPPPSDLDPGAAEWITRRGLLRRAAGTTVAAATLGAGVFAANATVAVTDAVAVANAGAPDGPVPYVGEVRMFAGALAPLNWALCDGQLLPIAAYGDLYTLLGTTYGGDGIIDFALPDLRGRIPIHSGGGRGLSYRILGERGGAEEVALDVATIPAHAHPPMGSLAVATTPVPTAASWATPPFGSLYSSGPVAVQLNPTAIGRAGDDLPHPNVMPSLCVNFIIALYGVLPARA
jgi:microcystin-dependent protein